VTPATYLWHLAIAVDQAANAILLGEPDETISARLGRWAQLQDRGWRWRIARSLCGTLDLIDPHHCEKAAAPRRDVRHELTLRRFPYGAARHAPDLRDRTA